MVTGQLRAILGSLAVFGEFAALLRSHFHNWLDRSDTRVAVVRLIVGELKWSRGEPRPHDGLSSSAVGQKKILQ